MVLVKDILSKHVITIKKDQSVNEAIDLMDKKKISCIVVVKDKLFLEVEGILTNRDILNRIISKKLDIDKTRVKDVMTSPVRTIGPNDSMFYTSTIMNSSAIKQLPVVENGELVGIVTQTDIMRHLIDLIF
jgi:CBS domain-containing protein